MVRFLNRNRKVCQSNKLFVFFLLLLLPHRLPPFSIFLVFFFLHFFFIVGFRFVVISIFISLFSSSALFSRPFSFYVVDFSVIFFSSSSSFLFHNFPSALCFRGFMCEGRGCRVSVCIHLYKNCGISLCLV